MYCTKNNLCYQIYTYVHSLWTYALIQTNACDIIHMQILFTYKQPTYVRIYSYIRMYIRTYLESLEGVNLYRESKEKRNDI